MSKNILIGLGGTGARAVEAALVLQAAGLGPRDGLHVGLIDQDGQNGNSGRTQELFRALQRVQNLYDGGDGRLFGSKVAALQRSDFNYREGETIILKPDDDARSLKDLLDRDHLSREKALLLEQLFTDEELERTTEKGYEGRAHVGSAAINLALGKGGNLEAIRKQVQVRNEEVRVVLVGSAFGGTGASCFPTIARKILEWKFQDSAGKSYDEPKFDIRVSGVLLLPYFEFADPGPSEQKVYALKSEELIAGTRQALEYYADLLSSQPQLFDRLYVTGWDNLIRFNYRAESGDDQKNPPLPPDLFAANAALDVMCVADDFNWGEDQYAFRNAGALFCGREGEACSWDDVPGHVSGTPGLSNFLRLAFLTRYQLAPDLRQGRPSVWGELIDRNSELQKIDALSSTNGRPGLFDLVLKWAAAVHAFSTQFEMWNAEYAVCDRLHPELGAEFLEELEYDSATIFDRLIGRNQQRRLHQFYEELNDFESWYGQPNQPEPYELMRVSKKASRLGGER